MEAIRRIPFVSQRTNIAASLRLLRDTMYDPRNGGRLSAKHVCLMVTDGEANIDPLQTVHEAVLTHQSGIQVVVVAVGLPAFVNSDQVYAIASEPKDRNIIWITDYNSLPNASVPLILSTCNGVSRSQSGFDNKNQNQYLNYNICPSYGETPITIRSS